MKEQVNSAYDLSLFEAAPELEPKKHPKKNNVIVLPKEKLIRKQEDDIIYFMSLQFLFLLLFLRLFRLLLYSQMYL